MSCFQNPENGLVAPFVEDDVAFGLENLGVPVAEMRERVPAALRAVGLEGYEERETHTLSGGEKQRLALAGLLAVGPGVLVLDEPTSMLDPSGRGGLLRILDGLRGDKTVMHVYPPFGGVDPGGPHTGPQQRSVGGRSRPQTSCSPMRSL